ncbi:hypothetical protein [Chromatium okenii]
MRIINQQPRASVTAICISAGSGARSPSMLNTPSVAINAAGLLQLTD